MAENDDLDTNGGSFSQLLLSDDVMGMQTIDQTFHFYPSSFPTDEKPNPPKMLCFGGNYDSLFSPQKSGLTCSDSSSASSGNSLSNSNFKKRNGSAQEQAQKQSINTIAKSSKKPKSENQSSTGNPKVRKEKLGERIMALQQLVSPFGKTDTASVLHEAMGYIRFLHDQVQVLCSPYLQTLPICDGGENREERCKDMRSTGLCLVPVEWTVRVANSNGADFWSPAMVNREE